MRQSQPGVRGEGTFSLFFSRLQIGDSGIPWGGAEMVPPIVVIGEHEVCNACDEPVPSDRVQFSAANPQREPQLPRERRPQ